MEFLKTMLLSALAVFAPIYAVLIVVGLLVSLDLILGVMAARKRGEEISSAAFRRTVTKMFVFQSAVLTGYLLEVYLLGGLLPVTKLVAGVIGMTEFISILENVTSITGVSFKDIIIKLGSKNDQK